MNARGWKGTGTYGVAVSKADAAHYFKRAWTHVEIEIDGQVQKYPLRPSFWTTCPEFRGGALKAWMVRNKLAPWPYGHPPELVLTPLGGNRFRVSVA